MLTIKLGCRLPHVQIEESDKNVDLNLSVESIDFLKEERDPLMLNVSNLSLKS